MNKPYDPITVGVISILVGVAFLTVMDAGMKYLLSDGLAVFQILALRSLMVVPVLSLWMFMRGGVAAFKTGLPKIHLLRVVLGTGAPVFFFTSLKTLPLADTTTIFFGASFIMTGLSVVILKEHVGPHRWAAVIFGFAGVVIAMQPGAGGFVVEEGSLYALASSLFYSLFMLTTRKMGLGEGVLKQVLYFHVWLGLLGTISLAFEYRPFTLDEVTLVAGISCLVFGGHVYITKAFATAPVGIIAPFEYSAIIWAVLLGYLIWGDIPGPSVIWGAGIIVSSGLYVMYRESKIKSLNKLKPLI